MELMHLGIGIALIACAQYVHCLPPWETFYETPEMIIYSGYPCESYEIITADGYVLLLFRIPHGKQGKPGGDPVVLFPAYGLSSRDWFTMDHTEDNLPFMLVNAGYDVWLVNSRGTRYSQRHTTFTTDDVEYWNYSFHEIGKYEVPAIMSYILNKTGKSQLSYVCHSMGCTVFVVCIDQYPELNAQFRRVVFMAGATYLEHMRMPVKLARMLPPNLMLLLKQKVASGRQLQVWANNVLRNKGPFLCTKKPGVSWKMCIALYFLVNGFHYEAYTEKKTAIIVGNALEEASAKISTHYMQWIMKPYMRQYDYGKVKNIAIYGSMKPPEYDVSKIKVPVMVMYAANDKLTVAEDAIRTIMELEKGQGALIHDPKFMHMDFMYASSAPDLVFPRILQFLR